MPLLSMPMAMDCVSPKPRVGEWQPAQVLSLFRPVIVSNHSNRPRLARAGSTAWPRRCSRLESIFPVKRSCWSREISCRSRVSPFWARAACGWSRSTPAERNARNEPLANLWEIIINYLKELIGAPLESDNAAPQSADIQIKSAFFHCLIPTPVYGAFPWLWNSAPLPDPPGGSLYGSSAYIGPA